MTLQIAKAKYLETKGCPIKETNFARRIAVAATGADDWLMAGCSNKDYILTDTHFANAMILRMGLPPDNVMRKNCGACMQISSGERPFTLPCLSKMTQPGIRRPPQ